MQAGRRRFGGKLAFRSASPGEVFEFYKRTQILLGKAIRHARAGSAEMSFSLGTNVSRRIVPSEPASKWPVYR